MGRTVFIGFDNLEENMIPDEWKDADFSDNLVRNAFADWLEERSDWRAEEIRRIWVWNRSGRLFEDNFDHYFIMSGPLVVYTAINLATMKSRCYEIISDIMRSKLWDWHGKCKEISPANWK